MSLKIQTPATITARPIGWNRLIDMVWGFDHFLPRWSRSTAGLCRGRPRREWGRLPRWSPSSAGPARPWWWRPLSWPRWSLEEGLFIWGEGKLNRLTCPVEDSDGAHVAQGPAQQPVVVLVLPCVPLVTVENHHERIDGVLEPRREEEVRVEFGAVPSHLPSGPRATPSMMPVLSKVMK